jgi:tetratricopeptide (TPR) repeat protein
MRFVLKLVSVVLGVLGLWAGAAARAQETGGRVVLVLPFENRSGNPSLSWIGDSFPDTLNKRLTPVGFLTLSRDDRTFAYDHLGLPEGFKPSRATAIKIAQQLDANFIIIGSFNVTQAASETPSVANAPDTDVTANENITIQAQVLSVDELTLSPPVQDGSTLNQLFNAENAIAWKVARMLDPHFNIAEETFLAAPGGVPLPAFEDYIRGANAATAEERVQRLKAAVALVPDYAAALLALGKEQYALRDYAAAAATLAKVPPGDRLALEANFYLGLARFNNANYAGADEAFGFVVSRLPLPEVVNDQGVALSRQAKDAVAQFERAMEADPSNEDYHYNLALALFRRGDTASASREVEAALKLKPEDKEAIDLRVRLAAVPVGTRLTANADSSFAPAERIIRIYSESSYRQAAFQMDQMRAARLATLPPAERTAETVQLGRDYLSQGLLPEAEGQFNAALAADPRSAAAHAGLAQVREMSGQPELARKEARMSLQLQANAAAWVVLGRLDYAANQLDMSSGDVIQALQLEPTNAGALALRQVLQQRGQKIP